MICRHIPVEVLLHLLRGQGELSGHYISPTQGGKDAHDARQSVELLLLKIFMQG